MGKVNTDGIATVIRSVISISFNVLVVAVLVMLIFNYAGKAYDFGRAIFVDESATDKEHEKAIVVTIPKGATNKNVAAILKKADLIDDKNVFYVKILLSSYKDSIQPGTYSILTSTKPSEILAMISKAPVIKEEASSEEETTEEAKP